MAQDRSRLFSYGVALGLVAATLGVALLLRALLHLPDLEMLFLLAVLATALWFGRGPSLVAAALGVATYDFFFVPPLYTFSVSDNRYVLTFATMFVVSMVLSELTLRSARLAEQAQQAALRARTEALRSSLLSAVSHDLRTPLASITGAATTLRDASLEPDTRSELVEAIVDQAQRLERLVGNLLDMTRLESGAVALRRDWVPLDEIVGSALTRPWIEAQLAERPIAVRIAPDVPLLLVDPVLFEQVFVNLLENAHKYTPVESPLEIAAQSDSTHALITFSDEGPGLPAGAETKVFEKFYRGPHAGSAGAGLGLAICKGIVEAHGGTIIARNRPHAGVTFSISLPHPGAPP